MVDFSEYLNFLEELEHTLQQLVDVEQKKAAAVSARDLDALNDCMKREQAFSMTLKGFEQKRARLLAALGLEDVSLRELPSRCPPEHREAARRMSERLINQYRILSSAQEPSRILMESRLRLIEEELQRRGLEEEGPSTASRTGSDTFGSFNTVRLGIYAAQKGLDVTGNNITNINTAGYTRQRLDQVSLITSASDRYYSPYKTRVGQGVLTTGVSQLRDPGLDIAYRNASADVGAADAKLAGLEKLASILDEVGKGDGEQDDGVLLNQLNDLRDLINKAITSGLDSTQEGLIRASAKALCSLFNDAADKLADMTETWETQLKDQVDTVNNILTSLRDLNISIRDADIRGDAALELRDQRNLLLDQLSQYMDIDVKYEMEDVGAGLMVEKMTVTLGTGGKDTLVDGKYATKLETGDATKGYLISLHPLQDKTGNKHPQAPNAPKQLDDNDLYGALQSTREMLTEAGEYTIDGTTNDPNAAVKRGIPYYQKALDSLAHEFAAAMNELNHIYDDKGNLLAGGNLFSMGSATNDASAITAANISISQAWAEDKVSLQASTKPDAPSGDTSNLSKFLALFDQKIKFDPDHVAGGDAVGEAYHGTFEDMLLHVQSVLAEDQMTTTALLTNYSATASEVYTDREGVMGVDLNDEATSLMTYQKAYTAACRLMTVLEEALDSLINGTVV